MSQKSAWSKVVWTDATHSRIVRPTVNKPLPPITRIGDGKKAPPRDEINVWIPQRYRPGAMMAKAEKDFKRKTVEMEAGKLDTVFENLYSRADLRRKQIAAKREAAYKKIEQPVKRLPRDEEDVGVRLAVRSVEHRTARHAAAVAAACRRPPPVVLSPEEADESLGRLFYEALEHKVEAREALAEEYAAPIDRTFVARPAPPPPGTNR